MRERTTWNRETNKQAATTRTAEDPRAMNQDHLGQQPSADKYVTGDPSTFAEDVTKPNTWDVEYANGQTKRDEIGMPEKRPETYNHPEKTAALDEATLLKKADLCTRVAKLMLRGRKFANEASLEAAVEDQSVALMHIPNMDLIATANRLADDEEAAPAQQQQQAAQQQEPAQGQQQQQAQQQQEPAQQQQAAQQQEPAQQGQQQSGMQQQSIEQMVQTAVQQAMQQHQQQGASAMQEQAQQQQVPAAPAQEQQAQQQAPAPEQQQMQQQGDDQLLDEMLMGQGQGEAPSEMDIEMETPSMDVGEVVLAHEDEVLKTLFSNDESEAQQAQQGGEQQGEQKQANVRTASTRTVGTKPTGGVSKVGGAPSGRTGGDVDKLAALWPSAPDVRDAFNMK